MFHGTTELLPSLSGRHTHFQGDNLSDPLKIKANAYNMPDVFCPSGSLVVSESVRDALGEIPNVLFLEVQFTKLINLAYQANDYNYEKSLRTIYNIKMSKNYDRLYEIMPNQLELYGALGHYYEIVVPRLADLSVNNHQVIEINSIPTSFMGEMTIKVSKEILAHYPMFWHMCVFINESVFEKLGPFLDNNYFMVGRTCV
jgi:hypothetical protein